MAIRNVFGAQSIRQKLLLGTLFLAIIPVAVTSIIVGRESLNSGRAALEAQAREALIAQRASKAAQITDYFDSLSNQVQVLAAVAGRDRRHARAAGRLRQLGAQHRRPARRTRAPRQVLHQRFHGGVPEAQHRQMVNMADTVAALPDLAMNLQYQYIAANPHPLGSKNNLDRANDGSRYSEMHGAMHPYLRTALRQFGLYDIFLDRAAQRHDRLHGVQGARLRDLAGERAVREIASRRCLPPVLGARQARQVALSEFGEYLPSYNDQAAFLGTPIFEGGKKIGVLRRAGAHRQDQLGHDARRQVEGARPRRHR